MEIQFVICSQSISIDQATSRLSLFNVLDNLTVPAFPVWIPELTIVASILRSPTDSMEVKATIGCGLASKSSGEMR